MSEERLSWRPDKRIFGAALSRRHAHCETAGGRKPRMHSEMNSSSLKRNALAKSAHLPVCTVCSLAARHATIRHAGWH
jgi:hypothetical protein